jgi:hypothetical protein
MLAAFWPAAFRFPFPPRLSFSHPESGPTLPRSFRRSYCSRPCEPGSGGVIMKLLLGDIAQKRGVAPQTPMQANASVARPRLSRTLRCTALRGMPGARALTQPPDRAAVAVGGCCSCAGGASTATWSACNPVFLSTLFGCWVLGGPPEALQCQTDCLSPSLSGQSPLTCWGGKERTDTCCWLGSLLLFLLLVERHTLPRVATRSVLRR